MPDTLWLRGAILLSVLSLLSTVLCASTLLAIYCKCEASQNDLQIMQHPLCKRATSPVSLSERLLIPHKHCQHCKPRYTQSLTSVAVSTPMQMKVRKHLTDLRCRTIRWLKKLHQNLQVASISDNQFYMGIFLGDLRSITPLRHVCENLFWGPERITMTIFSI